MIRYTAIMVRTSLGESPLLFFQRLSDLTQVGFRDAAPAVSLSFPTRASAERCLRYNSYGNHGLCFFDAILRTVLGSSMTIEDANMALQGLIKEFGVAFADTDEESINWYAVYQAATETLETDDTEATGEI